MSIFTQRVEKTAVHPPKNGKAASGFSLRETLKSKRKPSHSRYVRVSLRESLRFAYTLNVLSRIKSLVSSRISSKLSFAGKLLGSGSDALPAVLLCFLPNPRRKVVEVRKESLQREKHVKRGEKQGDFQQVKPQMAFKAIQNCPLLVLMALAADITVPSCSLDYFYFLSEQSSPKNIKICFRQEPPGCVRPGDLANLSSNRQLLEQQS